MLLIQHPCPPPTHFCKWKKSAAYKKQLCPTKAVNRINYMDTFFLLCSKEAEHFTTFLSFISLTTTGPGLSITVRLNCLPSPAFTHHKVIWICSWEFLLPRRTLSPCLPESVVLIIKNSVWGPFSWGCSLLSIGNVWDSPSVSPTHRVYSIHDMWMHFCS